MTTAILIKDSTTGFLRTGRKVYNLRPAERVAVGAMFVGKPVVVTTDYLRNGDLQFQHYGRVLACATVDHGTCKAVLVLQLDDVETPHALPLSQVLAIEEIVGTLADRAGGA